MQLVGAAVVATSLAVARSGVPAAEAWVFRLLNDLPDALEKPMWVAQLGGLLLIPLGLAAVASVLRRWRLALALVLLVPAKLFVEYQVIKAVADRQRPATSICDGDLTCLHLRDAPAAGVSMPSGHAVIAMAIWWLVAPYLPRRWVWGTLAACLMVPVARVYLGAHNPLDVVAGGAAGIVIAASLNLLVGVPGGRR
jgi:membrane-associated phospholipid phosphatase